MKQIIAIKRARRGSEAPRISKAGHGKPGKENHKFCAPAVDNRRRGAEFNTIVAGSTVN
ncbi:hypothetical protein ACFFJ7_00600 [Pseudochelatococcus lubricantis]|uniref:hypothetical protein n=1 Tax=Pseudochelatococcus lubricantis TaxID=1538102 RepID=UPI0035E64CC6